MREDSIKVFNELAAMKNWIQELSDKLNDFCNKSKAQVDSGDKGEAIKLVKLLAFLVSYFLLLFF